MGTSIKKVGEGGGSARINELQGRRPKASCPIPVVNLNVQHAICNLI